MNSGRQYDVGFSCCLSETCFPQLIEANRAAPTLGHVPTSNSCSCPAISEAKRLKWLLFSALFMNSCLMTSCCSTCASPCVCDRLLLSMIPLLMHTWCSCVIEPMFALFSCSYNSNNILSRQRSNIPLHPRLLPSLLAKEHITAACWRNKTNLFDPELFPDTM